VDETQYQKELRRSQRLRRVIDQGLAELDKAETKHPGWPNDLLHQVMIVSEEMGEVQQATLNYVEYAIGTTWGGDLGGLNDKIDAEMVQVLAMALRFLYHRR
jgi:hypothetical protein